MSVLLVCGACRRVIPRDRCESLALEYCGSSRPDQTRTEFGRLSGKGGSGANFHHGDTESTETARRTARIMWEPELNLQAMLAD
jgi:hypothetical protein